VEVQVAEEGKEERLGVVGAYGVGQVEGLTEVMLAFGNLSPRHRHHELARQPPARRTPRRLLHEPPRQLVLLHPSSGPPCTRSGRVEPDRDPLGHAQHEQRQPRAQLRALVLARSPSLDRRERVVRRLVLALSLVEHAPDQAHARGDRFPDVVLARGGDQFVESGEACDKV